MTTKEKKKILKILACMNTKQIELLQQNTFKLGVKECSATSEYRNGWSYENVYQGATWKHFLDILKEGNDAPRGGEWGKFIIFRNNKHNKEIINFVRNVIKLF